MKFVSTRDVLQQEKISASQAIIRGLAPDGGLYVPDGIPAFSESDILSLCKKSYCERAAFVLSKYLDDYTCEELLEDCLKAYAPSSFPGSSPCPLVRVHDNVYVLELWHGPTAAFKDMALQIMPRLLSRALRKNGVDETALILVATSGDTGKAALEGYKDVPQVKIMVFYPRDGVSRVQKLQMMTQTGDNVSVCAIKGNFDDAQTGVKKIFSDKAFAKKLGDQGYILSSANSINWGRLAPQIAYYVSAYCDLLNAGAVRYGDPFDVCVPTGNFGNIFAAYLAKRSGLPIRRLICASNKNHILTDFLSTGEYDRNRTFFTTMSPSMDILISSNLERLLYFLGGSKKTGQFMSSLSETGLYRIDAEMLEAVRKEFTGFFTTEEETAQTIRRYFDDHGYLADTHTSVALHAANEYAKTAGREVPLVVDSTASPYKFAQDVCKALRPDLSFEDPMEALDQLVKLSGKEIPYPLKGIADRKIRFEDVIEPAKMPEAVLGFVRRT